jgi:copper chaperone NosL
MMTKRRTMLALAATLLVATGCQDEAAAPAPERLTRAAIGHYCNMIVADHPGPKAQVHERGLSHPLWFSSVRDALAYNALPGEAQNVAAIYVHDMGQADTWGSPPGEGAWIRAEEALYVLGSDRVGGMGAREAAPFGDRAKAENFVKSHGGHIVGFGDIPADYIIGDANDYGAGPAISDRSADDRKPAVDHSGPAHAHNGSRRDG